MERKREEWSGKLGFVLAASGSAIGLGNLWKFPYITWNNEGGAFVIVYLICIALIGLPIMCAEILIGRRSQSSVVSAFGALGYPWCGFIGWLGVLAGVVILGFYSVIAGWSLASFAECLTWSFSGYEAPADDAFGNFLADPGQQIMLAAAFSLLTAVIVTGGIKGGIERATRILMPCLLAILVYLVFTVSQMDGFSRTLSFLFQPDFSSIETKGVLEALGHAFFTLSLGMGAMITYGSYVRKSDSVLSISLTVVILDTLIALAACLIMFTIIFSIAGMEEQVRGEGGGSTVGMLFVTLPKLFYTEMTGGAVLGPLFYLLVAFAALSSTISLLEVAVAFFVDRLGWNRLPSTLTAASGIFALSIFSALSLGANETLSTMKLFGSGAEGGVQDWLNQTFTANKGGVLSILDHVSANWLLPVGGFFITLFAGWVLPKSESFQELAGIEEGQRPPLWVGIWLFFIRFVAPLAIGWIIWEVFVEGVDFS